MKITSLTVDGFRGLPDRTFSFVDPTTGAPLDRVLITGPSGSGKTSVLDAIVAAKEDVAPYGFAPPRLEQIRAGAEAAKILVTWWLGEEERGVAGTRAETVSSESVFDRAGLFNAGPDHDPGLQTVLERYDHDPAHGKVDYFRVTRSLDADLTGAWALRPAQQRRLRLSSDTRKYAALPRFLLELVADAAERPGESERFRRLFAALCPTRELLGTRRGGDDRVLLFRGRRGEDVPLSLLTPSEQQALLFAATAVFVGLGSSLVLVDEPELHIGDDRIVAFVDALAHLGDDNQLIVATGSRELVAAAPPGSVIRLDA